MASWKFPPVFPPFPHPLPSICYTSNDYPYSPFCYTTLRAETDTTKPRKEEKEKHVEMYPPTAQYTSLPTSDPGLHHQPSRALNRLTTVRRKRLSRPLVFLLSISSLAILVYTLSTTFSSPIASTAPSWAPSDLFFNASRPSYLASPPPEPLRLRIAIISRVDEFERRRLLRETVLRGVGEEDVKMDFRFFVGKPAGWKVRMRLWWEGWWAGNDVMILETLKDIPQRLSEKRFKALQWVSSSSFFFLDSLPFLFGVFLRSSYISSATATSGDQFLTS